MRDGTTPERPAWSEHVVDKPGKHFGRTFFYNRLTKERSWKRPVEFQEMERSSSSSGSGSTGSRGNGSRGSEATSTEAKSSTATAQSSASVEESFSRRKSLFDTEGRAPRASKLALYAFYMEQSKLDESEPSRPKPADADSDSGRPPSEGGDTGASGGKNGFILDDEGFWVRFPQCFLWAPLSRAVLSAPRHHRPAFLTPHPHSHAPLRLSTPVQTRTDDIEAEYADALGESISPPTFKQKFVIRELPVSADTSPASDPQLLREASATLGLPPALPPGAGRRRRASAAAAAPSERFDEASSPPPTPHPSAVHAASQPHGAAAQTHTRVHAQSRSHLQGAAAPPAPVGAAGCLRPPSSAPSQKEVAATPPPDGARSGARGKQRSLSAPVAPVEEVDDEEDWL